MLRIDPESTVVSRLRHAFHSQPQALRFILHGDEHPRFEELVAAAAPYPVTVVVVPVSDTCKEVEGGVIRRTVPRESLVEARGPWIFSKEGLADALVKTAGREAEIRDMIGFCEAARLRVRALTGPWTATAAWRR